MGPAHTVAEAFATVVNCAPAAAILDVNLHGERCEPAADVLAAGNVPMAFATGLHSNAISDRFSGSLTLAKPYDFEQMSPVVSSLLSKAEGSAARGRSIGSQRHMMNCGHRKIKQPGQVFAGHRT